MKNPIKWFEEAVKSGKYDKDVIDEIISCISEDGISINRFMEWVSEQLEKEMSED
jgi:hypothetical protein